MKKLWLFLAVLACFGSSQASWYWPFGPDDEEGPRLSVLMKDATRLIDDATELSAENKVKEAVAKYREALTELAKIEASNPERAKTPEFTSLRNKRAYVNAAIDSLLLSEARDNAKAVAITDTTELEKKFLRKKGLLPPEEETEKVEKVKPVPAPEVAEVAEKEEKPEKKQVKRPSADKLSSLLAKDPDNRKLRLSLIGEYIREGRYVDAKNTIEPLLKKNMNDSSALNLRAICEASQGDFKLAEETLFLSIKSNPHDYNGYYNMANLKLQNAGNKDAARLYYETGRKMGGPRDKTLEEAVK